MGGSRGGERRLVLVLTSSEVIGARQLVTVAPVTTHVCGLGTEVELDPKGLGLDAPSVVNGDGNHTIE